jgi:glyoxylase-like metal-dependent hydrolase (beta-lactamase superfamily II)
MRITPIIASRFRSDGGTIFGPVPKAMWSKAVACDEQNRIDQHALSLLVELDDGRQGLIETGCGDPSLYPEKARGHHALGEGWPLMEALGKRGLSPDAIQFVIFTHLHWDHVSGAVTAAAGEAGGLSFPRARHFVHEAEWRLATGDDPLLYKAYPPAQVKVLQRHAEQSLELVHDQDREVLPGIRLVRSGGHTRGHAVVVMRSDRLVLDHPGAEAWSLSEVVLAGDVCASTHHLRLVCCMAYDTYPLITRYWKRSWLPHLAHNGAMLLFGHDPETLGATLHLKSDATVELGRVVSWSG